MLYGCTALQTCGLQPRRAVTFGNTFPFRPLPEPRDMANFRDRVGPEPAVRHLHPYVCETE